MMKSTICHILLLLSVIVYTMKADDCLYTNNEGFWCRCSGEKATCKVATVKYDTCGHGDTISETQHLVGKCVVMQLDPQHNAYINKCTDSGDVEKFWYRSPDCSGYSEFSQLLSKNIAPCARILCGDVVNSATHSQSVSLSLLFTIFR